MGAKYYARIDLDEKRYCYLYKIEDFEGFTLDEKTKSWIPSKIALDAPLDTTHFDEISYDEAKELAEELGAEI